MKKTFRILSLMLSLVLVFTCFSFGSFAVEKNDILPATTLHFTNGKFKILVLSDIHESADDDAAWHDTKAIMTAAIAKSQPDLVVFNGDNIDNKNDPANAIRKITNVVKEANIPLAVVFGNHDEETGLAELTQLQTYCEYDRCLAVPGPSDIFGVGNYNIPIFASENSIRIAFNLWFLDSNSTANGGYDAVHKDQIEWYEAQSNFLKLLNGNKPIPSILFQHICVPEMYEALTPSSLPRYWAVGGHGSYGDRYWVLNEASHIDGVLREGPCPPDFNNGQFDSWLKMGDVKLAVFGHDHVNTFSSNVRGITLMQAGGVGFKTYDDGISQAASLITVNSADGSFTREILTYRDLVGNYCESYDFSDYFGRNCWWSIAKFNWVPVFSALFDALGAILK